MSNQAVYATKSVSPQYTRKTKMKNWLRRKLRNFISHDDVAHPVSAESGDVFRGDFSGWQFRMHRAVGGTILEAWRYPQQSYSNSHNKSSSNTNEHELFIIGDHEELNVELPHILTQLALR